jgi:DNA-binding NarL/FixJ family response regulator
MNSITSGIGVLVVDDNDILGQSMQRWMTGSKGARCVGYTDDVNEARSLMAELQPDVLLLDVDIPGGDTFGLLRWTALEHPRVKVVMLSGHLRQDYVERALDEGASGYIVKDESPATILELVIRAAAGEIVLSSTARSWMDDPTR